MKVYIAGPYTKGDVAQNVANATRLADYLANLGYTPYLPHLTHFWHMMYPRPYEWWLKYDMEWLRECDCVVRIFGDSSGADKEVSCAGELGKDVFIFYGFEIQNLNRFDEWLARRKYNQKEDCSNGREKDKRDQGRP